MSVAPVPQLPDDLLLAHAAVHEDLAVAAERADGDVRSIFGHLERRLAHESLAYVQSVSTRADAQLIFPPPRSFLTRAQQLRMRGAGAAFRHIDTRVTLVQRGDLTTAMDASTLPALHALFEGPDPGGRESNPGMLRASPTAWLETINPFEHPDPTDVPALVDEVLAVAADRSIPVAARAAWTTFMMLSVHPFVDGNGRTCRALYLLVAGPDLPLGIDWGILEQWSVTRHVYIEALQAGNKIPRYDPALMSAEPFAVYSTAASIRGAEVCIQRLQEIDRRYSARREAGWSAGAAVVGGLIDHQRSCTPDELLAAGLPAERLDDAVAELLARGAIRWAPRPASRRTLDDPATSALVLC